MSSLFLALAGLAGASLRTADDVADRDLGNLLLAGAVIAAASTAGR